MSVACESVVSPSPSPSPTPSPPVSLASSLESSSQASAPVASTSAKHSDPIRMTKRWGDLVMLSGYQLDRRARKNRAPSAVSGARPAHPAICGETALRDGSHGLQPKPHRDLQRGLQSRGLGLGEFQH